MLSVSVTFMHFFFFQEGEEKVKVDLLLILINTSLKVKSFVLGIQRFKVDFQILALCQFK